MLHAVNVHSPRCQTKFLSFSTRFTLFSSRFDALIRLLLHILLRKCLKISPVHVLVPRDEDVRRNVSVKREKEQSKTHKKNFSEVLNLIDNKQSIYERNKNNKIKNKSARSRRHYRSELVSVRS